MTLEITIMETCEKRTARVGNPFDNTFSGYLFVPTDDGRMVLSEAHFVEGKNEVRPLGTFIPDRDTKSYKDRMVYTITPLPSDEVERVRMMVYRRNFGE
jgi:hypothetical protein